MDIIWPFLFCIREEKLDTAYAGQIFATFPRFSQISEIESKVQSKIESKAGSKAESKAESKAQTKAEFKADFFCFNFCGRCRRRPAGQGALAANQGPPAGRQAAAAAAAKMKKEKLKKSLARVGVLTGNKIEMAV